MVIRLDFARHDPAHCLAPGLFRALRKGERKTAKLDITYEFGDGERLEFSGPEPLGADDLRVLQGLVAMAGPDGILLHPEPADEDARQLWLAMDVKFDALKNNSLVVRGSFGMLARETGMTCSGKSYSLIRESIERLFKVSVFVQSGKRRAGFHLLSFVASDDASGQLFVALNPRIAQAILGERQYARIEMREVRAIKSDPARLIHQRLSAWVNPSSSRVVALTTLAGYVWTGTASASTTRKRLERTRKALLELEACGWGFTHYADGNVLVKRP